jgi:large conductance mechanosensitive channel
MAKKKVETTEAAPKKEPKKNLIKEKAWFLSGFFEFLQQYSVIGLAIGIVIGDASKNLVNSLVAGFITPFIGLFLPSNQSLQSYTKTIRGQQFQVGQLIMTSISFVIILLLLYLVIKILLRRDDLLEKK